MCGGGRMCHGVWPVDVSRYVLEIGGRPSSGKTSSQTGDLRNPNLGLGDPLTHLWMTVVTAPLAPRTLLPPPSRAAARAALPLLLRELRPDRRRASKARRNVQ